MTNTHQKWCEAQKLHFIQEVEQNGLTETLRKYNLAPSFFHRWQGSYTDEGLTGLQSKYLATNINAVILMNN